MDPNAALVQIRELIVKHWDEFGLRDGEVDELTDLIDGLDKWITKGGFLPSDWNKA
jgi:hypothetical protein